LLISFTCALFVQSTALALPTSTKFGAFLDAGPSLSGVGSISFELTGEQVGMLGSGWAIMCTYLVQWQAPSGAPYTQFCTVNEPTSLGFTNCEANAHETRDTIVMRMPNSPCAGFDDNGEAHNVFHLVTGESDTGLLGLIQFTAASSRVRGFVALEPGGTDADAGSATSTPDPPPDP